LSTPALYTVVHPCALYNFIRHTSRTAVQDIRKSAIDFSFQCNTFGTITHSADVWKQVENCILMASEQLPPPSLPPTHKGAPPIGLS